MNMYWYGCLWKIQSGTTLNGGISWFVKQIFGQWGVGISLGVAPIRSYCSWGCFAPASCIHNSAFLCSAFTNILLLVCDPFFSEGSDSTHHC